ncbi:MAG: beta strand repeat-containing protein [Terriglobales bacterium]
MKTKRARLSVFGCELTLLFLLAGGLPAQQAPTAGSPQGQAVPHLVKFSGAVKDAGGTPRTGVTGITFALYKDQAGGAALWLETQNVTLDAQGRFTVLLGANSAEGMPLELFTANEAQWLGVQPEGLPEQRVLLVSVPYALKAADAETLGGMPASSFVLAAPVVNSGSGSSGSQTSGTASTNSAAGSSTNGISPATTCTSGSCAVSTSAPGGTVNFLPLFTDPTTVQNSVLAQSPCPFDASQTCVGIGNPSPARILDVNGEVRVGGGNLFLERDKTDSLARRNWAWGTETFNVGDVSLFVSSSNVGYASISPVFTALSNGFMGVGVATPAANLEVAGTGGGLLVDSPGVITGSGAGLKNLPAASLTGTLPQATLNGANGSGLANVNAAMLGGNPPSAFATTLSNTFTGNQSVAGNLSLSGSLAGGAASLNSLALPNTTSASVGVITLGATPFLHNFGTNNTFVGASAGNTAMDPVNASGNTAVGASALSANTTGTANSAFGAGALAANTTGGGSSTTGGNSAFGRNALFANTTGGSNSAFGSGALKANTTVCCNSAFGAGALSTDTTGANNSAFGNAALSANTTGGGNTAFGDVALYLNTTGIQNSAFGNAALRANTTGNWNAAFGVNALLVNTTASYNSAFGISALSNLNGGQNNIALGYLAGNNLTAAESNNIYIGNVGVAGESNTIRIGTAGTQTATFLAGNVTAAGMVQSAAGGFKFPDNTIQTTAATGGGGGGTVSSVGSGLGLVGGPITTTGTLAIDPTVVPQLGAANTFSANQTITGNNSTQIVSITQNGAGNGLVASTASTTSLTGAVVGTATGSGEVAGVAGFATGSGGAGVYGQASGSNGAGVYGQASASNGAAGVFNIIGTTGQILVGWASGVDKFRVDATGKGFFDGGTQTGGADFAESLAVAGDRASYEPGDLLVIDPAGERRLALARRPYSTLVAGIYSTKPGVLATPYQIDDGRVSHEVPLAVVGVVPCKVSAENGPIAVGDLLVTSRTPGHAMKGSNRSRMLGAVVGKALEPLTSGKGVIQVLVTLQ